MSWLYGCSPISYLVCVDACSYRYHSPLMNFLCCLFQDQPRLLHLSNEFDIFAEASACRSVNVSDWEGFYVNAPMAPFPEKSTAILKLNGPFFIKSLK